MSRSFRDFRATFYRPYRLTKVILRVDEISASMTFNVDLNSATSASVRVYADSMIEHSEMRLSRFPPDAQPRPTILSQVNSKEKNRNWPACITSCRQLRKLEPRDSRALWPTTEEQDSR